MAETGFQILTPALIKRWFLERALAPSPYEMPKTSLVDDDEDPIQSLAYDPERYPHCIELEKPL